MIYSIYNYIKNKFFNKQEIIKKDKDNNCIILNLGYLPNDSPV
jgi:hypothetical protein